MEAKLVVVGGKANMGEVKLRLPMTIGRGSKADLIISHATVSRIHCELTEVDGALVVRDNDSSNGTFLDDVQVKQTVVKPGQILRIGPLSFRADYEWSGSTPKLAPRADNPGLAATQTMSFEDLMGEEGSATSPSSKPAAKAKSPAKPEPKKEVAKGKPAPEPPKKKPAAPAPVVNKDVGATDDDFDFNKEIEFIDDAGIAEPPKPAEPAAGAMTLDDADGDFDFLADLEEPKPIPAPAPPKAKVEPPKKAEPPAKSEPKAKSEPAPAPKVEKVEAEAEFDFLADLDAPSAAPGHEPAATGNELSSLVEPPDEKFRKHTPTETVDFDFLGGFKKSNADSLAPEPEAPKAEEFPSFDEPVDETPPAPVEEAKAEAEFDVDAFVEEMDVVSEKLEEAAEQAEEVAREEAREEEATDAAKIETPKTEAEVDFDFLAEMETEPAAEAAAPPKAVATPEVVAPSEPETVAPAKAEDEDAFFDFLAEEPAAAPEAKTPEPEIVAEAPTVDEPIADEEPAKSEADAWSFDVEPEPAADVTAPFLNLTTEETEPAAPIAPPAAFEPPAVEDVSVTQSKAVEPTMEDAAFDFLDEVETPAKAAEPAAEAFPSFEATPNSSEVEATVEFRADDFAEPAAPAPAFSFEPVEAEAPAESAAASPFAIDEPAPSGAESFEAAPAVAPAAPVARMPATTKPSFLDKLKTLFSFAAKKKSATAKAKGAAPAKKPGTAGGVQVSEPVLPFAVTPIAPRGDAPIPLADVPIPLSDEPINLGDETDVPTPRSESAPPADDFAVDDFLAESPAPQSPAAETPTPELDWPVAAAPSATIDEIPVVDEPALDGPTFDPPVIETFAVSEPPTAAPASEEVDAFDFLAKEQAAEAAEAPSVAAPQAEAPAADEFAFNALDEAPADAAASWDVGPPSSPIDEPTAETPEELTAEAVTKPAEDEFDFGSFLDEPAPEATAETPVASAEPPVETAATEEADIADEIFGFDVEPAAGAVADLPAPEQTTPEPAWFEMAAPAEAALDAPTPQAAGSAADPDVEKFLFEPDAEPVEARHEFEVGDVAAPAEMEYAPASADVESASAMAEASPMSFAPAPPSTRVRSMDVDARLTASHRSFARVAVRGPRVDYPQMEPDMPAGRSFNRTGRRPSAQPAAAPEEAVTQAPETTAAAPFTAAAAAAAEFGDMTMAFNDMTADLPPVSPPNEFADTPSDDFNFLGNEPAGESPAAVAETPTPEAPAAETMPDDLFTFEEENAAIAATTEVAEPPSATTPASEPADELFDFLADEASQTTAEAGPSADENAVAEAPVAEGDFSFLDEAPAAEEKKEAAPPNAKKNDQELDDFFNDLGMG